MIQILGKKSPAKQQFVYTLAMLLATHYGKYEIYTENYSSVSEDYVDGLSVHPLQNYCGQDMCIIEAESYTLAADHTICYLTPYQPEILSLLRYVEAEKPKKVMAVFGDYISESVLNKKYLTKLIAEKSADTKAEILTVELDKLDKLICNEGIFEGYYQISSLSGEYKNALAAILEGTDEISYKVSKKYFRQERRKLK